MSFKKVTGGADEMSEQGIKVGDMVQTGVYVLGEWRGIYTGRVVQQSSDGTTCQVDVMSHNGGRPWVHFEATIHLRKLDTPNVELTGAARPYCAASSDRRERG